MSQEFKDWLQEAGIEFDSLEPDKKVQYKVSFDQAKCKYFTFLKLLFNHEIVEFLFLY